MSKSVDNDHLPYQVNMTIDPAFSIGQVNRRLFGGFVEHMGRCVYTGIFEPHHPTADSNGFALTYLN